VGEIIRGQKSSDSSKQNSGILKQLGDFETFGGKLGDFETVSLERESSREREL
jgi:hypothetical protein